MQKFIKNDIWLYIVNLQWYNKFVPLMPPQFEFLNSFYNYTPKQDTVCTRWLVHSKLQ